MSARLEVGELVDIHIRGARYVEPHGALLGFDVGDNRVWLPQAGVDVSRVAPKEWPPQPGDVWEDSHGGSWWGRIHEDEPCLQSEKCGTNEAGWVLDQYGPMTLAYRKGWTPETTPAAVEPEQLDKRAEVIAGIREMADWFEANPEVPIDLYGWEMLSCISKPTDEAEHAELLRVAELVGEPANLTASHPGVKKMFRGRVAYRAYYIPTAKPADEAATSVGEETEHAHVGGAAGGPGENAAECECGATFAGFDTHAEAMDVLNLHIAEQSGPTS